MPTPSRWHTLAASLLLSACGPPRDLVTGGATSHDAHGPAFTVGEPPPSQAARATFERPPILPLERAGCRFEVARWDNTQQGANLYLAAGTQPWGYLPKHATVPASVTIESGWGLGVIELAQSGVAIKAIVHADELAVRARQTVVLEGYAVPLPRRRLVLGEIGGGDVQVSFFLGSEFVDGTWLRAEWGCGDVGLEVAAFEPPVLAAPSLGPAFLSAGRLVELRAAPAGPVVARLQPEDDLSVDVLERRQNMARIRWVSEDMLFFGWVDATSALAPLGALYGMGGLGLAGSARAAPEKRPWPVRCNKDLPLVVWQRGLARTVGTLGPTARFEPSVMLGELTAIHIRDLDIELRDGSFYTVAAELSKHCAAVTEP